MTTVATIQSSTSPPRRPKVMRNPTIQWDGVLDTLPRISIVTPCFNHAEYVEAAILSILEQGYPNLDYVIIDGGSTDRSAGVIGSYADYLSHWESRRDAGQYPAFQPFQERPAGRRNVAELIGDAGMAQRRDCVAAAGHRDERSGAGQPRRCARHGDSRRVEGRDLERAKRSVPHQGGAIAEPRLDRGGAIRAEVENHLVVRHRVNRDGLRRRAGFELRGDDRIVRK